MESISSNNTQTDIKNGPVFDGRNKCIVYECRSKLCVVCLSVYSNSVSDACQGKIQPLSTLRSADTPTLNVIAERTWTEASRYF